MRQDATPGRRILTGIKPTGEVHLGNYLGAIRPALARGEEAGVSCCFFLADYHALINTQDPRQLADSCVKTAAAWIALGLDPAKSLFYRQSDIPEIMELNWILSCVAAKGLLNRAHAYKAAVELNTQQRRVDADKGISMGLYCYPVLMAADILAFAADEVPVGQDQIQHVEMARDMAQRFNYLYGDLLTVPRALLPKNQQPIVGLDGRKMSKSYNNVIPLFASSAELKKLVMKIRTNSQLPEEPKDPSTCQLYHLYSAFSDLAGAHALAVDYRNGIGWGEVKQRLFALLDAALEQPRERYRELLAQRRTWLAEQLAEGATQARREARELLQRLREAVGLVPLNQGI